MDYTHLIFHEDISKKTGNFHEPSFGGSSQQNADGINSFQGQTPHQEKIINALQRNLIPQSESF